MRENGCQKHVVIIPLANWVVPTRYGHDKSGMLILGRHGSTGRGARGRRTSADFGRSRRRSIERIVADDAFVLDEIENFVESRDDGFIRRAIASTHTGLVIFIRRDAVFIVDTWVAIDVWFVGLKNARYSVDIAIGADNVTKRVDKCVHCLVRGGRLG